MYLRDTTPELIRSSFKAIGFDELRFAPVREGLQYWQSLCGARAYPARDQIMPRAICRILCSALLIKVIEGGADFEYAIVGDEVARTYRAHLARRKLSEVAVEMPVSSAYWGTVYRDICAIRQPRAVRYSVQLDNEANFADAEAVLLPLGPDDETVDHIITFAKRTRHLG